VLAHFIQHALQNDNIFVLTPTTSDLGLIEMVEPPFPALLEGSIMFFTSKGEYSEGDVRPLVLTALTGYMETYLTAWRKTWSSY